MVGRSGLALSLCLLFAVSAVPAGEEEAVTLTMPKAGTFWYRMEDAAGHPMGYARLSVSAQGGGLLAEWTMKLAFPGGKYEEERRMALDAAFLLTEAAYSADGNTVGEVRYGAEDRPAVDAASGVIFLCAAMAPLEPGAVLTRTELNEADGFKPLGATTFTCEAPEEVAIDGAKVPAFRVRMARKDGRSLTAWVSPDREVLQVDWSGGTWMRRSRESTEALFKPPPPVLREVESPGDRLVLTGDFPNLTPAQLYDHFTKPELLTKWWPPQAQVDLKPGGVYRLVWPGQWTLSGEVRACDPGKRFVFRWRWEHDPQEDREVEVLFEALPAGGTRLWVLHGRYGEGAAESGARGGHRQGWEFFLSRLRAP
jgi:uncharacterized protein YndB with AHSA1/START domain